MVSKSNRILMHQSEEKTEIVSTVNKLFLLILRTKKVTSQQACPEAMQDLKIPVKPPVNVSKND